LKLRAYIASIAWLLLLTSCAKFYSATGSAQVLDLPEALLPISNRHALILIGLIEGITAFYLWRGNSTLIKLICIGWLGGNFALYRLASILFVVGKPCPCLGSITERIPLKPATINNLLVGMVFYMLVGSTFFLVSLRNRRRSVEGVAAESVVS